GFWVLGFGFWVLGFGFWVLSLTFSGTLFFSRIEKCRLGFADRTSAKERRRHGQICREQI
ncbi:MAG: hypothetical protein ACTID2_21160, partial [Hafnia alvei]|uniref:hypothetical protein n=1 Tax=Hafnia alvei TaxID=569 RepID=UPI003F9148C3